jgi:hypothetical protein
MTTRETLAVVANHLVMNAIGNVSIIVADGRSSRFGRMIKNDDAAIAKVGEFALLFLRKRLELRYTRG